MPGKGRPPGQPKSGGRKKGTPNKTTAALQELISSAKMTPLEFMLSIQDDPEQPIEFRADMAKSAAPYVHARKVQSDDSLTLKTDEGNALVELVGTVTEVLGRLKKKHEDPEA